MSLFSFSRMQNNMHKIVWNPTPRPSPNNIGFRSLRAKTLCVSFTLLEGGGGGGTFKKVLLFEALFSRLWKKKPWHFFHRKGVGNCLISADSEQLGKSLRNSHIGPACTEPFNRYCDTTRPKLTKTTPTDCHSKVAFTRPLVLIFCDANHSKFQG